MNRENIIDFSTVNCECLVSYRTQELIECKPFSFLIISNFVVQTCGKLDKLKFMRLGIKEWKQSQ